MAAHNGMGAILTDQMILALIQNINSQDDLRKLSTGGLGVKKNVVDKHLFNERNGSIHEAAHKVIGEWRRNQLNSQEAYNNMFHGLTTAGMTEAREEALGN